jgi:hypothetical protein
MTKLRYVLRLKVNSTFKCIRLNARYYRTKWIKFDENIASTCFVKNLENVSLLPYDLALRSWQEGKACCVVGIAQSVDFQDFLLLLVPSGPKGGVVCNVVLVKNELRFKEMSEHLNLTMVRGLSECYLNGDKQNHVKIFPLQTVGFFSYDEEQDQTGEEVWVDHMGGRVIYFVIKFIFRAFKCYFYRQLRLQDAWFSPLPRKKLIS